MTKRTLSWVLPVCAMLLGGAMTPSYAQNPTEDQLLKALSGVATRSLSGGGSTAPAASSKDESSFLSTLRNRSTRSLSGAERAQIYELASAKPSVDMEINFDYNSPDISAKAMPEVEKLGRVLSRPELKDTTFLLAGHTDAKGNDKYNQTLSDRRADAIKRILIGKFGISADRLIAVGYGETHLKNEGEPNAGENRRVQIANLASTVASR